MSEQVLADGPSSQSLSKLFSFSTALIHLKDGRKVKREGWGGYWYLATGVEAEHAPTAGDHEGPNIGFVMAKLIVAVLKDNGGPAPAQPYQSDLLAEDWQIVD